MTEEILSQRGIRVLVPVAAFVIIIWGVNQVQSVLAPSPYILLVLSLVILLIAFSIVFLLLKRLSTLGYYSNYPSAKENQVIKFSVIKSREWSLADVMVVSIIVAYMGSNWIMSSQFGQLSKASQELVIVTTNGTSLQPGYYLFVIYTVLVLFFSGFLDRKPQASEGKHL